MTCLFRFMHRALAPGQRAKKRRVDVLSRRLLAVTLALVAPGAWPACTVSVQGVNFGSYDPFGRNPVDSAGNVAVTCDAGVSYAIALSSGGGPYAARVMANGSYLLQYNLYTDAARVMVWGDGNGGTATVGGSGTGSASNVTIYGRIPASQNAHVGNYADNVIVTVTF